MPHYPGDSATRPIARQGRTHEKGVSHPPEDGVRPHNLPTRLQRPFGWSGRRPLAASELGRQPRTMGGAVGGELLYVGYGGDQACVAGAEQLVRAMACDAGDRPRHRTHLPSELPGFGCHPQRPRPCASFNDHRRARQGPPTVGSGPGTDVASAPNREEAR